MWRSGIIVRIGIVRHMTMVVSLEWVIGLQVLERDLSLTMPASPDEPQRLRDAE